MIKRILEIYLQIREAEKKQKQLDKMKANPMNYGILRDLLNSARAGVLIEVKMVDGTTLILKQDNPITKPALSGEYF